MSYIMVQGRGTGGAVLEEGHWWEEKVRGKEGNEIDIARVKTRRESG